MENLTFVLDGNLFSDIRGFYAEINRLFMHNADWKIGESLDALNDILYGGFGSFNVAQPIVIVWKNANKSKADLGVEMTREWLQNKITSKKNYNTALLKSQLKKLEEGNGQTYFEIILEIFQEHKNITLLL